MKQNSEPTPTKASPVLSKVGDVSDVIGAAKYVEGELQAYLELEFAGANPRSSVIEAVKRLSAGIALGLPGSALSKDLDEMVLKLKTVSGPDVSGTQAKLEARIEMLQEELDAHKRKLAAFEAVDNRVHLCQPFSKIEGVIGLRSQEMRNAGMVLENTLQRRDQCVAEIQELGQQLRTASRRERPGLEQSRADLRAKLEAMDTCIEAHRGLASKLEPEIEMLVCYRNAILLVRKGLPEELFKAKLKK
jgi:hypothetical protein